MLAAQWGAYAVSIGRHMAMELDGEEDPDEANRLVNRHALCKPVL